MKRVLAALLVLSVVVVTVVGAQITTTTTTIDDFEDQDTNVKAEDWDGWFAVGEEPLTFDTTEPINGTASGLVNSGADGNDAADNVQRANTTERITPEQVEYYWFYKESLEDLGGSQVEFIIKNGSDVLVEIEYEGGTGVYEREAIGCGAVPASTIHHVEIHDINYTAGTFNVSVNGEQCVTDGSFRNPSTGGMDTIELRAKTGNFESIAGRFDNIQVVDESVQALDLEVSTYMDHGDVRDYKVFAGTTDVTSDATVTSGNTSVITVDESAQTLTATSDTSINQVVTITASYEGESVEEEVFVGNKSLNHIASLPPPTWPSAIFGHPAGTTGSSSTWPGAVQLQWIFVCLVLGAIVSWKSFNPFMGLATVEILLAFGWAIDWVSDGLLIASIIFLVYAALSLTDVASGNLGRPGTP